MEPTEWQRAGSLAELQEAKAMMARVAGKRVAMFLVGADVVATNGRCPHAGGPLHEGEVEGQIVTCPWHGWSFNLVTGLCEDDPALTLERFPVRVEGDDILVVLS